MFTGTSKRRTNKTSSDLCLPDLPHTRPDHPQVRPPFFSASGLDRALGQLAGLHLRLTLCRLSLKADRGTRLAAAEALQNPSLMISDLDDGSLLILYIGPRRAGSEGDLEAEREVTKKLREVLGEIPDAGDFTVAMTHCWSDAMDLRYGVDDPFALVPAASLRHRKRAAA